MTDINDFVKEIDLIQNDTPVIIVKKNKQLEVKSLPEILNNKLSEVGEYLHQEFPVSETKSIVEIPENLRFWFSLSIIDKKFKLLETTDKELLNSLLIYEDDSDSKELIKQRLAEL